MPVYRLTYKKLTHLDAILPHQTELIAPKGWAQDEIIDAFVNQYPDSKILSCVKIES